MRQAQGSAHGFVLLKSEDGKVIAIGDLIDTAQGDLVRSRLVLHFLDGSIDDETTVFRQRRTLQLISDRHIQRGPSYPQPLDLLINVPTGQVTSRTVKDGKQEVKTEHMDKSPDFSTGMLPAVLENFPSQAAEEKFALIAGDPKPRLVGLSIKPLGKDTYDIGGAKRQALVYNLHIDIGGIAGVVAPLVGKQPSDIQAWVTEGEVHTLLKLQGAFYLKGPIWTMELTSPRWR